LEGLGTVIAYKTVTVRPRVDGLLSSVQFREGQAVKQGEVLAQIDPRPYLIQLHQAEGNLVRDRALLKGTQLNVDRYIKLTGKKYVPQQQLDDTRGLLGQYQGAVQIDQAQVENARLNLSYTRITAPIDGVTGVRTVDPGNLVRATDTTGIVTLTQLDPIAVLFTLPQDDLYAISEHMQDQADLRVDVYDREGATLLGTGTLLLIDNQINQTTATIRLKAVFSNPERKLWPNQFVKALLHLTTVKAALVAPAAAIQRGPQGNFVYVVNGDQTVSTRGVEVRPAGQDSVIVKSGLSGGERLVTEGQPQLKPGSKVQVTSAPPGAQPSPTPGVP
jgi:multidrug efflux system membrane fusion protein